MQYESMPSNNNKNIAQLKRQNHTRMNDKLQSIIQYRELILKCLGVD
jgi:hypothetical protein